MVSLLLILTKVKVTVFTGNLENIHFLIIFDNISNIIQSRVIILDQKEPVERPSKWCNIWWPWPLVKVNRFTNIWKISIFDISNTIHSIVMKLGQKVACGETLKYMWYWVTLTKGQGHSLYLILIIVKKISILKNFDNLSETIYWKPGSLWPPHSPDTTYQTQHLRLTCLLCVRSDLLEQTPPLCPPTVHFFQFQSLP